MLAPEELRWLQLEVRRTYVADAVLDFSLAVVAATREHPDVRVGASSRAALSLLRCAQARALVAGRNYVVPDDIKLLAPTALGHRIVLAPGIAGPVSTGATSAGVAIVREVLASVPVPLRS